MSPGSLFLYLIDKGILIRALRTRKCNTRQSGLAPIFGKVKVKYARFKLPAGLKRKTLSVYKLLHEDDYLNKFSLTLRLAFSLTRAEGGRRLVKRAANLFLARRKFRLSARPPVFHACNQSNFMAALVN